MDLYGSLVANEGSGGGGGGTVDVPIKSISVNGSGVAPVNKNVNIDLTGYAENDDVDKLASSVHNQFDTASGGYIRVTNSVDGIITELGIDGKSVQNKYEGYNLIPFPYHEESKSENNVTFTINPDTSINVVAKRASAETHFSICHSDNPIILNKGTYHIEQPSAFVFFRVYNVTTDSHVMLADRSSPTFTITEDNQKITIDLIVDINSKNKINVYPMLVKVADDGTYPTKYEPYVGCSPSPSPSYPQEIKSAGASGSIVVKSYADNLIPCPYYDGKVIKGGFVATPLPNGVVSVNKLGYGANGDLFNFTCYSEDASSLIKLDPSKKYAFFNPLKTDLKDIIELHIKVFLNSDNVANNKGNTYSLTRGNLDSNGAVIISGYSYAHITLYNYYVDDIYINLLFAPMLVEVNEDGTYPTDYQMYKSSSVTIPLSEPLRSTGDIKDEITYKNDKWGILRRTGSTILDGTERSLDRFDPYDSETSNCYIVRDKFNKAENAGYLIDCFSTHFDMVNSEKLLKAKGKAFFEGASGGGSILYLSLGKDIATINDFKNFLSTNKPEFIYKLKTPTFEQLEDQTLTYLSTCDGVTNISSDDDVSPEIRIKYPTTDVSGVVSVDEIRIDKLEETKADKCAIADIDKTNIELIDSTNYSIGDNSSYSFYQVVNGICYVDLILNCVNPVNEDTPDPGHLSLPKARGSFHAILSGVNDANDNIVQYVSSSGVSFFKNGTAGKLYVGHFSYPVAE